MAVKEKTRGLETIVDEFKGLYELEEAVSGLAAGYRSFEKTSSELRRTVEGAMNDRGRLLKSKLDRDAIRDKIETLRTWLQDVTWSREELDLAIEALENEIEDLTAAVEA